MAVSFDTERYLNRYCVFVRMPSTTNRGKFEIIAKMLEVAMRGALKTRIMYRANLSHRQLQKYLDITIESGLLSRHNSPEVYFTTEKGIDFIRDWAKVYGYFKESEA